MDNHPIINLFKQHGDRYLSGEQLSVMLNMSRTAVWKKINKLKQEGYSIEARHRLGYRLMDSPEPLSLVTLQTELTTQRFGRKVEYFSETSSTQNIARNLATEGRKEGHLVIAEMQTAGRGRLGRTWHSPKGKGLWFSLLLQPNVPLRAMSQLTLLTAVALCKALRDETQLAVGIKWPNDLLIDGKKVCGILMESMAEEDRIQYVIAGIGISVNLLEEDYLDELLPIAQSLRMAANKKFAREKILASFLNRFEELYDDYHANGFDDIKRNWEEMSLTMHQNVRVQQLNRTLEGAATGIDELGALLLLQENGEIVRCYSGDVTF